jgi:hypothetical protein
MSPDELIKIFNDELLQPLLVYTFFACLSQSKHDLSQLSNLALRCNKMRHTLDATTSDHNQPVR